MCSGIKTIDVHGCNRNQAMTYIWRAVKNSDQSVYTVQVIHGFNNGTVIKDTIRNEYGKGNNKVVRICPGDNPGVTNLILRELF